MYLLLLSIFLLIISAASALLFLSEIRSLTNGRRAVRILALITTVFVGGVYSAVALGVYPSGLPPELGRTVVVLQAVSIFGWAITSRGIVGEQ